MRVVQQQYRAIAAGVVELVARRVPVVGQAAGVVVVADEPWVALADGDQTPELVVVLTPGLVQMPT